MLHGIDKPNLWHGNTLTGQETYGGLFAMPTDNRFDELVSLVKTQFTPRPLNAIAIA